MKIKVLGSAAAEGMPALWCECETCAEARRRQGKDLRRRTSYLLDDDTMIDFGPDVFWQTMEFGIDLKNIRRLIVTHPHGDHLSPLELLFRKNGWFSSVTRRIQVYGSRSIFGAIIEFAARDSAFSDLKSELQIDPMELHPGKAVIDPVDSLEILPLEANHAPGRDPLIYLLKKDGKTILIGNDTGWFPESTWKLLEGKHIDLAFLDCTGGIAGKDWFYGHMGADTVIKVVEKLREMNVVDATSTVYANHFSHNGHSLHEDLERYLAPHGIPVAYDGLALSL